MICEVPPTRTAQRISPLTPLSLPLHMKEMGGDRGTCLVGAVPLGVVVGLGHQHQDGAQRAVRERGRGAHPRRLALAQHKDELECELPCACKSQSARPHHA